MIVTRPKKIEEILRETAACPEIAVIGCGLCATSCQTGGKKEVAAMAATLSAEGKTIVWTEVVDGVCQKMITARALSRLAGPPAVLVMACGSGVQTVAGIVGAPVFPALDSLFLGSILRVGQFEEKCSLCGSCLVNDFEGQCPVTLCPKGILNGPCGGMDEGKCEVDPARDCVWLRIYRMKEAAGKTTDLDRIVPPRSRRRGSRD